MARLKGSTHAQARSDSKVARLWAWARRKKRPWTTLEAAEGAGMSRTRCRTTVKALRDAGLVVEVDPQRSLGGRNGCTLPTYALTAEAAAIATAPVLVMHHTERSTTIAGVRFPD